MSTDTTPDVDSVAEQARRRARDEREVVEWAVEELGRQCEARDVELEPLLDYARRSAQGLPDRHREAYEAMADEFAVDRELYAVYALAFSRCCEELVDEPPDSAQRGCTNALVAPSRSATGSPLVLKNRDIAGRGVRPKSIVEQPAIDGYHGFRTVDTCGTVMLYKGVNDRGLVAANTYIDVERGDVDPADQRRNGTVIRRLLEERASVAEARAQLRETPTRELAAQTLVLADGDDAVVLEVDPVAEEIRADDDPVSVRTNHFVDGESPEPASSTRRRDRALSLLRGRDEVDRSDRDGQPARADADRDEIDRETLWTVARDHEHGPGDDSICRHPEPETDEPHAFGQLTTASAAVFEGGSPTVEVVMGNPCETSPTRSTIDEGIPSAFRSGRRWPGRVRDPIPASLRGRSDD